MRVLTALVAWVLLFLLFLLLRFPYRTVFERAVTRIETSTGADLAWEEADVGMLGVDLRGFEVRMASGARFTADRATFRPAWGGLSASFQQTQQGGAGTARLNGSQLSLHAEKLQVETGSRDMPGMSVSGDLAYNLAGREGSGELRMGVPKLTLPIVGEIPLEVGAKVKIAPLNPAGSDIAADVSLYGQDLSGGGPVRLRSQPGGGDPALSGTLQIQSPLGRNAVRLSGTWSRPEFVPQGVGL